VRDFLIGLFNKKKEVPLQLFFRLVNTFSVKYVSLIINHKYGVSNFTNYREWFVFISRSFLDEKKYYEKTTKNYG